MDEFRKAVGSDGKVCPLGPLRKMKVYGICRMGRSRGKRLALGREASSHPWRSVCL
jgi:hypothetical protein